MKISTLREQMASNDSYAISYIVKNNEAAVADGLRGFDYSINGPEDIFETINELLAARRFDDVAMVLNVPMLTEGIDEAQMRTVLDVGTGMAQAAKSAGRAKYNPVVTHIPDEEIEYVDLPGGGSAAASTGDGGVTFNNVFGSIMAGFATIWGATQGDVQVDIEDTSGEVNANAAAEAAAKAKRNRNILIGVAVAVAIVVVFIAWKALKK